MRRKAPHELDLGSLSLSERTSGIDYGLQLNQLDASGMQHRETLSKHVSAWGRHARIGPIKRQRSVFTAGLTSILALICSATSHAWPLQVQDMEHCIRPTEKQYPPAADLLRQLLYLNPLARPSAAQALQHAWFHQT